MALWGIRAQLQGFESSLIYWHYLKFIFIELRVWYGKREKKPSKTSMKWVTDAAALTEIAKSRSYSTCCCLECASPRTTALQGTKEMEQNPRWKHPQRRRVVILCHSSFLDALHHDSHILAALLMPLQSFLKAPHLSGCVNQNSWNNFTGIRGWLCAADCRESLAAGSFSDYLSNPPVIRLWAQIHPMLHTPAISYHWHWTLLPQFQFTLQYHKKEMENVSFPDQHLNVLDYKTAQDWKTHSCCPDFL